MTKSWKKDYFIPFVSLQREMSETLSTKTNNNLITNKPTTFVSVTLSISSLPKLLPTLLLSPPLQTELNQEEKEKVRDVLHTVIFDRLDEFDSLPSAVGVRGKLEKGREVGKLAVKGMECCSVLFPEDGLFPFHFGARLLESELEKEGMECLRVAEERDPNFLPTKWFLAKGLMKSGGEEERKQALELLESLAGSMKEPEFSVKKIEGGSGEGEEGNVFFGRGQQEEELEEEESLQQRVTTTTTIISKGEIYHTCWLLLFTSDQISQFHPLCPFGDSVLP